MLAESGYCDTLTTGCVAKLADGDVCLSNTNGYECVSGYCELSASGFECCNTDCGQCQLCSSGACVPQTAGYACSACTSGTCACDGSSVCVDKRKVGEPCGASSMCLSGQCGSTSGLCEGTGVNGDPCVQTGQTVDPLVQAACTDSARCVSDGASGLVCDNQCLGQYAFANHECKFASAMHQRC